MLVQPFKAFVVCPFKLQIWSSRGQISIKDNDYVFKPIFCFDVSCYFICLFSLFFLNFVQHGLLIRLPMIKHLRTWQGFWPFSHERWVGLINKGFDGFDFLVWIMIFCRCITILPATMLPSKFSPGNSLVSWTLFLWFFAVYYVTLGCWFVFSSVFQGI